MCGVVDHYVCGVGISVCGVVGQCVWSSGSVFVE